MRRADNGPRDAKNSDGVLPRISTALVAEIPVLMTESDETSGSSCRFASAAAYGDNDRDHLTQVD